MSLRDDVRHIHRRLLANGYSNEEGLAVHLEAALDRFRGRSAPAPEPEEAPPEPAEAPAPEPEGEDLSALSYRELQERAKAADIPANQSKDDLIAALEG